jgi:hypothetical protein
VFQQERQPEAEDRTHSQSQESVSQRVGGYRSLRDRRIIPCPCRYLEAGFTHRAKIFRRFRDSFSVYVGNIVNDRLGSRCLGIPVGELEKPSVLDLCNG